MAFTQCSIVSSLQRSQVSEKQGNALRDGAQNAASNGGVTAPDLLAIPG